MKKNLFIISAMLFLLSCNAWKHSNTFTYEELKAQEYRDQLNKQSNYLIVDVRTAKEYQKGHIKNAINISYFGGDIKKYVDTLDKTKTVFIYCQTQHRSPFTAKIMKKKGFKKVVDLKGGFMKWENNQLPIEK